MAPSIVACGIYAIRNVLTGKSYIGSANNIGRRFKSHRSLLRRGLHHSKHLQASWGKHGEDAFRFEVLQQCAPEALLHTEQEFLDRNGGGYNIARVAESPMKGRNHTAESREKISASTRGVPKAAPLVAKGQKLPREWVERAAATHRGRTRSPETRAKIAASAMGNQKWLGRKHSEESIQRMRDAAKLRRRRSDP